MAINLKQLEVWFVTGSPHLYEPDSPNHPNFPPKKLKPGLAYHNTIVYKFSALK